MLLSEQLLLEAFEDERNLIFDKPELVDAAKQSFINGAVTCHALDLTRHNMTASKDSHRYAIAEICPKEYKVFADTYNNIVKNIQYAEKIGDTEHSRELRKKLKEYTDFGAVPAVKPRVIKSARLFPYSQSLKDGSIACVFVSKDNTARYKVVIDLNSGRIVTFYKFHPSDLIARAIEFESIELLELDKFGTLQVSESDVYAAIKNLESPLLTVAKKEKLMNKFFKDAGIAPQVKQQAIRKFEEELKNKV